MVDMTNDRIPAQHLGVVLGTATGWDKTGDFSVFYYDFVPNDAGLKFLRLEDIEDMSSAEVGLDVDFLEGVVALYVDDPINYPGDQREIVVNPDWSVFNKE